MTEQGRLRILVAEDDPAVRAALAELIEAEPGFELIGAVSDAPQAIELAAAAQPDVVLVDVRMPGGGGVTATRGINRRSPGSKVIALSGQGDRATVLEMLEAGVIGYLLKGTSVEEIIGAIKRASGGHGSLSIEVTGSVIAELAGQLSVRNRRERKQGSLERRIRRTLRDVAAFSMVLQPIVALRDRVTVGAEALARFVGPPQRAPSLWFAEAAIVGLREELELLALAKAIETLPELPSEVYLTVNASPMTVAASGFLKLLRAADGSRVVVEITEHAPINDYPQLESSLVKLRSLGVRLAIDDAGAGYSSLRHILELQPELIKLDMSLIRDIDRDRSKQALAAGLISFATTIDAVVIAEGIERSGEAKKLDELGVAYGQGYFFARPQPLPWRTPERRRLSTAHSD